MYSTEINRKGTMHEQLTAVQRMTATDETKYYMDKVYYDRERTRMVATDGKRLIVWDDAPEFFGQCFSGAPYSLQYKPGILIASNMIGQYPNIDRVLDGKTEHVLDSKGNELSVTIGQGKKSQSSNATEIAKIMVCSGCGVNYQFVLDVPSGEYQVLLNENKSQVRLVNNCFTILFATINW